MGRGRGARVALVADVQGNAVALEAVLDDLAERACDRVVCLGDVACGPEPRRALELLARADAAGLRGNMDDALARGGDPAPAGAGEDSDAARFAAVDAWAAARLGAAGRRALAARPLTLELPLGSGNRLLCCHGSLRSNDDAPASDTPAALLATLFEGVGGRVAVIATSNRHEPMLRRWATATRVRTLLHPGSVGWPAPGPDGLRTPVARYASLTASDGELEIAFREVRYDPATLDAAVRKSAMPHAAWYLRHWRLRGA